MLVIELSQEIVEPNRGQRVLHRYRFPEEGNRIIFNKEETEKKVRSLKSAVLCESSDQQVSHVSHQSMPSIHLLRYWRISMGKESSYSWSTCSRYLQSSI